MRLLFAIPIVLLPNTAHLPANVAVAGSLAALVIALLLGQRDPPHLARPGYLTPPMTGLFLVMLVGYAIAQWNDVSSAGRDLRDAKVAALYPLFYIAYRRSGLDVKATRQLIVLVMIVAAVAGIEAVGQGLKFNLAEYASSQRATGPFGDINAANRAGVFFAMFLPMFVASAMQPNHRKFVRWLAVAGGAILATAILFTFSRQSYLIAVLGILLLLLLRRSTLLVALAVLLIAISASVLPDSVIQRMQDTRQVDATGAVVFDDSTTSRFEIWKGALGMFADHPGGVGLGRFPEYIGNYSNHPNRDAHNGFLLMLAECGALGLAMMLWLFWRTWRLARRLRRSAGSEQPEARALALGFTVTVISMALGNVYGSPFLDGLVMYNFWILCGLIERYGIANTATTADIFRHRKPIDLGTRFPLAARASPGLAANRPQARQ